MRTESVNEVSLVSGMEWTVITTYDEDDRVISVTIES